MSSILVDLFLIFLAAKVAGELLERLGQPPVIGELLAGVLIGPHALGLLGAPSAALVGAFHGDGGSATEALRLAYHVLAELGVIILLFYVGLETRVSDLLSVGPRALLVAVLGIALPFAFGLVFMVLQPTERLTDAFTATTLVATSVGITARVMRDLGVLGTREAQIILGAAIIGAFLAGMVLAEAREQYQFEHQAQPLYQFLVPFFFVITGAEVNLAVFGEPGVLALAAVLTLLAVALVPGARRAPTRPCAVPLLSAWPWSPAAKWASSSPA